jgi:membrane associated rhomboid family serine protease
MHPKLKYPLLPFNLHYKIPLQDHCLLIICHLIHVCASLFINFSKLPVFLIVFEILLCSFVHLNLPHVIELIYIYIYDSTVLGLGRFFSFLIFTLSVGLLGGGISPWQGRYLNAGEHKHIINAHRHPCLEWNSSPRSQCSSGQRQFMP